MLKKKDFPIVKCFHIPGSPTVEFWCPFCKKWHIHGANNGDPKQWAGTRLAHCDDFKHWTDYWLEPYTQKEIRYMKEALKEPDPNQKIRKTHIPSPNR